MSKLSDKIESILSSYGVKDTEADVFHSNVDTVLSLSKKSSNVLFTQQVFEQNISDEELISQVKLNIEEIAENIKAVQYLMSKCNNDSMLIILNKDYSVQVDVSVYSYKKSYMCIRSDMMNYIMKLNKKSRQVYFNVIEYILSDICSAFDVSGETNHTYAEYRLEDVSEDFETLRYKNTDYIYLFDQFVDPNTLRVVPRNSGLFCSLCAKLKLSEINN